MPRMLSSRSWALGPSKQSSQLRPAFTRDEQLRHSYFSLRNGNLPTMNGQQINDIFSTDIVISPKKEHLIEDRNTEFS